MIVFSLFIFLIIIFSPLKINLYFVQIYFAYETTALVLSAVD